MIGHDLGPSYRVTKPDGSAFCMAADCACGITCYGTSLWKEVWPKHALHVAQVRAQWMGRRRHPSWREDA